MNTSSISSEFAPLSENVLKAMKSYYSKNEFKSHEAQIAAQQALQEYKKMRLALR